MPVTHGVVERQLDVLDLMRAETKVVGLALLVQMRNGQKAVVTREGRVLAVTVPKRRKRR